MHTSRIHRRRPSVERENAALKKQLACLRPQFVKALETIVSLKDQIREGIK